MKKLNPENNPNFHNGKNTGYEIDAEGNYHIAPLYQQQFDALENEAAGIKAMLASVTEHASQDLAKIAGQTRKLWIIMADDLGIDLSKKNCTYYNGVLKVTNKKE